jgi:hypothetical protein
MSAALRAKAARNVLSPVGNSCYLHPLRLLADKEHVAFPASGATGLCLTGTETGVNIDGILSALVPAHLNADVDGFQTVFQRKYRPDDRRNVWFSGLDQGEPVFSFFSMACSFSRWE